MKEYKITDILSILAITCSKGYTVLKLQFFSTEEQAKKISPYGVMCARYWMRDPGLLRRIEFHEEKDAETSRKEFFDTFRQLNGSPGATLEVARMLWGADSPQFRSLL